jgi:indole-3-glycerol phosphate synthase
VNEDRARTLLAGVPGERIRVFESGISTRSQVEQAVASGADAILVGTALMQADDPAAKMRELVGAA